MNRQEAAAALLKNHRNPEAWYVLGRAFAEEGDRAKARESYEWALKYDPDFTEARRALAALDAPPLPRWLQEEKGAEATAPSSVTPAEPEPLSDVPDWFEEYSAPSPAPSDPSVTMAYWFEGYSAPEEPPEPEPIPEAPPEPTLPDTPDWFEAYSAPDEPREPDPLYKMLEVPPEPPVARPIPRAEPEPALEPEPERWIEPEEAVLPTWLDGAINEPLLIKTPGARPERAPRAEPAPVATEEKVVGRSWSFWAAIAGCLVLLLCSSAAGLMWLTRGGESASDSSSAPPAQAAARSTRPPTWTPIGPTATPTPKPTPIPTATASLTGEAYNHPGFGVWWQRPNNGWSFSEPGVPADRSSIPLIALTSANGMQRADLVVLALPSDYPPSTLSFINFLLKVSPYEGLEVITEEIGIPVSQATVVEVARNPAVLMGTEDGMLWLIFRPTGVFMVDASGFTFPEEVHPLLSGLLFTNQTLEAEARNLEEQRAQLVRAAEQLRELGTRQTVPFAFKDQATLRQEMIRHIAELDKDQVKAEEQMLKLLEILPEHINLLELSLELYSTHIAGFYDPDEATFYLISDDTDGKPLDLETRMVFIHEYTHALQDQHFGLAALGEAQMNHDEAVAFRSLVEGDAQWLTLLYLINNTAMNEINDLFDLLPSVNTAALAASPYYVRSEFTFPYIEGLAFVQEVQMKGGWEAVQALWQNPPRSTEQILHPSQYPADEPTTITLPEGIAEKMGEGWREAGRDTTGELGLLLLLQPYEMEFITAEQAAKGWDGDQYLYLTNGERGVYIQEFVWDRSLDSAEAERAFQDWFKINGLESEDKRHFLSSRRAGYVYAKGDSLFFAMARSEEDLASALTALGWK